jgi:hypothetical protein
LAQFGACFCPICRGSIPSNCSKGEDTVKNPSDLVSIPRPVDGNKTLHLLEPTSNDQFHLEIMTDAVNETEALFDSAAFSTFTSSSNQKDRWLQPILNLAFAILHRIETLLFYAGIHPSYITFRLRMTFQLLTSRFSPFPVQDSNKGQNEETGTSDSPSGSEFDGIAMTTKTRTIDVKRRRAKVSEQVLTGTSSPNWMCKHCEKIRADSDTIQCRKQLSWYGKPVRHLVLHELNPSGLSDSSKQFECDDVNKLTMCITVHLVVCFTDIFATASGFSH